MPKPESLGPYRILKTIGRGGMGTVYSAVRVDSGERVAVKLIAHAVADDPRFRERFTSEIKSLARLQHPGIVQFMHSHIDEDGRIFYSMELVAGESLQHVIRREKKIHWSRTIDLAIQICSALKHAHDAGVIHRDLKPANLMLTRTNEVKLVDFGIAKLFGDSQQTRIGSVLGTADYMAPEQAGTAAITPRTDLYALGNVMYALLVGRPPFTGKNVTQVIDSLKREPVTPLDLIDPHLPDELVELVHHLLQKDPAARPPTALVVMKRLQSMRAGLERRKKLPDPDDTPTHIPESDPGADTSSTGLPSDPSSATNEFRVQQAGHGTVPAPPIDVGSPSVSTEISRGRDQTILPDGSRPQKTNHRQEAVTDFHLTDDHSDPSRTSKPTHQRHSWQHWFTITMMAGVLVAAGGWFLYEAQPPSADELHKEAMQGDLGAMSAFLKRFPDDRRSADIRALQLESRLSSTLRRLSVQTSIGIAKLSAAEESFVSAFDQRAEEPDAALVRVENWLSIYKDSGSDDSGLAELIELAEFGRDQLSEQLSRQLSGARFDSAADSRAVELLADIRAIADGDDKESAIKRLQAIVATYQDSPWATVAIDEARAHLNELSKEP